jgi:hypothetical protein
MDTIARIGVGGGYLKFPHLALTHGLIGRRYLGRELAGRRNQRLRGRGNLCLRTKARSRKLKAES